MWISWGGMGHQRRGDGGRTAPSDVWDSRAEAKVSRTAAARPAATLSGGDGTSRWVILSISDLGRSVLAHALLLIFALFFVCTYSRLGCRRPHDDGGPVTGRLALDPERREEMGHAGLVGDALSLRCTNGAGGSQRTVRLHRAHGRGGHHQAAAAQLGRQQQRLDVPGAGQRDGAGGEPAGPFERRV